MVVVMAQEKIVCRGEGLDVVKVAYSTGQVGMGVGRAV